MRTLLGICFLLFHFLALGQVNHLGRFELEYQTEIQDYILVSNYEHGALLVTPRFRNSTKDYPIQLHFLDPDLNLVWESQITVEKRFGIKGYYAKGKITYLLFQNRTNDVFTKIVRIDPQNDKVTQLEPKQIVDLEITEFEVLQNTAVIGGYYEDRPAVFAYDMVSDKVRTLSNVYQKDSELIEIKVNSDSVTFNVLASTLTQNKDRTFMVNTYDYGGNAVRDYVLEMPKDYQLLTGVSSSIVDKEQVVTGIYTVSAGAYPSGFFVNHVSRTGIQDMKFYNFGQFENFLNHAGKRKQKLKDKALAAAESSKVWRYKTDGMFRELIETDGKILFTGEFYRPWSSSSMNQYRLQDQMSRYNRFNRAGGLGYQALRPTSQDLTRMGVPTEVNYTHSFAFEMDYQGRINWDNSMDIDETIDGNPGFIGDFIHYKGNAFYAYYHDELLVATHLNSSGDQAKAVAPIPLMDKDDELRYERDDYRGVLRWYENKLLVYGIHHVRNDNLRKVFFINVISLETDFETTKAEEN